MQQLLCQQGQSDPPLQALLFRFCCFVNSHYQVLWLNSNCSKYLVELVITLS